MRRNLVHRTAEAFRPPVFEPNTTPRARAGNAIRRFLDLQAGSAWRDMRNELQHTTGSLIDIGCGAQVFRDLVPAGVAYRGIDTIEAKDKFGYEVPDTHYFAGDDWGIAPASFDTALCTEVLEHIEQPGPFLARIAACLRPGGRLILTVPFAARWHFIPYDYWRYTPPTLDRLLREAGFDAVVVHARGNPVTVACYKLMSPILILLSGADLRPVTILKGLLGLALLPALGATAAIANATMDSDWGDDCLGYTVTAVRL